MKRILTITMTCLMVCVLAACGGKNGSVSKSDTPSDVVKKALTCAVNQDYKGMVKFFDGTAAATDQEVEEAAAVLELLYSLAGGISSFEILGEEIDENGKEAEVKVKLTDSKGESRTDDADLVKTDQGWRLTMD